MFVVVDQVDVVVEFGKDFDVYCIDCVVFGGFEVEWGFNLC